MPSLHRIWKVKRLSSTPNQIMSLLSTGHISPSLGGRDLDSPGHQRKSLKCLWQILHIRRHLQDVTNAYFVTHQCFFYRGALGRESRARRRPQGVPHFPEKVCIINVPNASVQF